MRGLFSLVLQDVHLFSGTIADNIRLGNAAIDDERVRQAARAVHADAVHRAAAGRLRQRRSPSAASTLSVGQKQLLSFARALAFDPRVLILDEATSSVDTETELLIRDALHVLMAGRTTIAIAHRLSTIQDMDKILVLHKGGCASRARTRSCSRERGIYFKLFELQYKTESEKIGRRRTMSVARSSTLEVRTRSARHGSRTSGSGRDGQRRGGSGRLNRRSRKPGVVARGFQPRRSTVR